MKIIKFFLSLFLVLFILFFITASVCVRIYGKSFFEGALNAALKRNVVLGEVSYHFPLGFRARNIHIARSLQGGEFLKIKKIIAQLSPNAVFQRRLAFDSVILVEPSVVIEGKTIPEEPKKEQAPRQGVIIPPSDDLSAEDDSRAAAEIPDKSEQTEIFVGRFIVQRGRLQYIEGLTEKGFSFNLEDVQLKSGQLTFPLKPGRSEFSMSARLVKEGSPLSGGDVRASGWVDVFKRDMEAKIEVVEANGTVGLTAEAVSENNNMEVTGEIKMLNLLYGIDKQISSDKSTVNDLAVNVLSSFGVEIGARFAFKTEMDNFRIGRISFSGSVLTK